MRVESGEFAGLIGPNGCGKSTLLRVLSRTLRPVSGTVRMNGRELRDWPARELARQLAFVPQQEQAAFDFTVRDVVLMGRHPHLDRWRGETEQDYQLVTQALADADILHLADRPITQLSGGEHRRALLARALAQQTPLLLLDEPTAHLDITHQAELLALVKRQTQERQMGALAALHDLNQAAEFCDRLLLLGRGRLIAEGTPEEVLTSANLRSVYDADAQIGCNPVTGRPMLLTLDPIRKGPRRPEATRVHVICGGGAGAGVLGALIRAGCQVTAGVLNRLDSDQLAAEALGIETVVEAPFSPIGGNAKAACALLIQRAQAVIITAVPFGKGNLANLELAADAQAAGKSIVLLGDLDFAYRDYSGGQASVILRKMLSNGAVRYDRAEDWLQREESAAIGESSVQSGGAH